MKILLIFIILMNVGAGILNVAVGVSPLFEGNFINIASGIMNLLIAGWLWRMRDV